MNMTDRERINRALQIIAQAAAATKARWLVGGSTGLMLRGLELKRPPRDLDLYADQEDAQALHGTLKDYSIDCQQRSVSAIYRSTLSHYRIEGVQVELVGGFVVASGEDRYEVEVAELLYPMRKTIEVGGCSVGLVPLAHEMWFNLLRDRPDRTSLIAQALHNEPDSHQQAFAAVQASGKNTFTDETIERLHRLIENAKAGGSS